MTRKRGNGSIYKQPGCSTWTIQYYSLAGKRVREATGETDYRAAQTKLREKLAALDRGEIPEPRRRQPVLTSELYEGLVRHYEVNGRKSLDAVKRRWLHLKATFADRPAHSITREILDGYVDTRLAEQAARASVNRELSALKTMLRLGARKHKLNLPLFPHLVENNVRAGFIEQADFDKLRAGASELWLRLFLEIGFEYGWRKREILGLHCRQANVETGLIRLDVGTTKNREGREVAMSAAIRELARQAIRGKTPDDYLLTREDGGRVRDFRKRWQVLCIEAGLGRMVCTGCNEPAKGTRCAKCKGKGLKYAGLIVHDLRRSAARELRKAGVAESVVMSIGGWRTAAMFRRYAITDAKDIANAIAKRQQARIEANSHDFSHDSASESREQAQAAKPRLQ